MNDSLFFRTADLLTATFVFALVSTAQVGRGSSSFVPTRTLIAALLLTLLSILMFLVLIQVTTNGLRVANAVQNVDSEARLVFDIVYPIDDAAAAAATAAVQSLQGQTPNQTVHPTGDSPRGSAFLRVGRASSCVSPAGELGCSASRGSRGKVA